MIIFLFEQLIQSQLKILELILFHSENLRVNAQAPFLIPDEIPEENQESSDHHPQEQSSRINTHHSSEKTFIEQIREQHPRGSHNHEIESAKPPQIDPGKKGSQSWNFSEQLADFIRNRIISGALWLFLSHARR